MESHDGFDFFGRALVVLGIGEEILADHLAVVPLAKEFLEVIGDVELIVFRLKDHLEVVQLLDFFAQQMDVVFL